MEFYIFVFNIFFFFFLLLSNRMPNKIIKIMSAKNFCGISVQRKEKERKINGDPNNDDVVTVVSFFFFFQWKKQILIRFESTSVLLILFPFANNSPIVIRILYGQSTTCSKHRYCESECRSTFETSFEKIR